MKILEIGLVGSAPQVPPARADRWLIPLFTTGFIHPKWLFGISSIDKYLALFEGFIFFEHIVCHYRNLRPGNMEVLLDQEVLDTQKKHHKFGHI